YLSKSEALKHFGLKDGKKTLLAVGGSLGAKSINEAIANSIDQIEKYDMQLIWQTGKTEAVKWKEYAKDKPTIWISDFITQMEYAYAAADIIISRAGAMTVAELCAVRKPVVFVPYPFAAEDHQTVNAKDLVQKGAACMVKDNEARQKVIPLVIEIMQDEQQQEHFKYNISQYAITNADEQIAKEILNAIHKKS
ncbi:MAG TPA: glycosyltransferase, partial [Chitinophagaceae bacterium]|nr:glycosyltransferase [Chitinophagaceae bacterium]